MANAGDEEPKALALVALDAKVHLNWRQINGFLVFHRNFLSKLCNESLMHAAKPTHRGKRLEPLCRRVAKALDLC